VTSADPNLRAECPQIGRVTLHKGAANIHPRSCLEAHRGSLARTAYDLGTTEPDLERGTSEPQHGGEYLRQLRTAGHLTVADVAKRVGINVHELEEIERNGTERLSYDQITSLVNATQPPRPSWWDQGHEHDLSLVEAHLPPRTGAEIRYWRRIGIVRAAIRLRRGRP
jgi:transcriptional regulator with XRE-family HTH domain